MYPHYGTGPDRGRRTRRQPARRARIWRWLGYAALAACLLGLAGAGVAAAYVYSQYKKVKAVDVQNIVWDLSTVIYDRNGRELKSLHTGENRVFVPLKDIPKHVQDAVLAIEDHRFWNHYGIDPYRLAGAIWNNLRRLVTGRGSLEGASTITQQLARNAFLTLDQTLSRKVQEAILALQLEQKYSKYEILEKYLNEIFFGYDFYGIGTAARAYFGKDVRQLTLAEGALLAGMIQAPNAYDPYRNFQAAKARQEVVLQQMVRHGFITQAQADAAKAEKLNLPGLPQRAAQRTRYTGAQYVDYVIDILTNPELAARYNLKAFDEDQLFRGGYKIYTALDPELQAIAEQAVAKVMDPAYQQKVPGRTYRPEALAWDPQHPENNIQAAVVMMNPRTGEVLAMVGGRTREAERELNRAAGVRRQPGSTIKPLAVYAPAFELLGYGPGTVIDDAPFEYNARTGTLWPENFETRTGGVSYRGLIPIRQAVEESRNAVAVQIMSRLTPQRAYEVATRLGLTSLQPSGPRNDMNLALALGGITNGVSLLELTHAYSTLANMGVRVEHPVLVTKIVDRYGTVIYEAKPARRTVLKDSTAWLLIDTLKGVIRRGTASYYTRGFNGWPAAGKTGTTEGNTDAWFVGFTPDLVTGVWNGYDNRQTKKYLPYTGAFVPVQIWNEIMTQAVKSPPQDWPRPQSVVQVEICAKTGLLPSPACPERRVEWFARGTEPRQQDTDFWTPPVPALKEKVQVGSRTIEVWKRWQPGCAPPQATRSFLVRPAFPKHPTDPYNPLYVPADFWETLWPDPCTPVRPAPAPKKPKDDEPRIPGIPGLTLPGQGASEPAGGEGQPGQGVPGQGAPLPDQGLRTPPGDGTGPGQGTPPAPGATPDSGAQPVPGGQAGQGTQQGTQPAPSPQPGIQPAPGGSGGPGQGGQVPPTRGTGQRSGRRARSGGARTRTEVPPAEVGA